MEGSTQSSQSRTNKKRKRIPPGSDSDHHPNSNKNYQKPSTSPDVEIMAKLSNKSIQQTRDRSSSIDSSSPILNRTPPIINNDSLKQTIKNNFKFLILDGPTYYSNHQALKKMVESAQSFLEEEPDETIYQIELDEKSSQLKDSQVSFDNQLNIAATPLVDSLTQFIQSQVERELKIRLDHSLRDHSNRLEKKFDQKLRNQPLTKPQIDQTTTDKIIKQLQTKLNQTENHQLQQLVDKKLNEIDNIYKKRIDHLQSKLEIIETNLIKQRTQLGPLEEKLPENESNHPIDPRHNHNNNTITSKASSPDTTRTSAGNALRLTLSPKTITPQPPHPSNRHQSLSLTQTPTLNRPKPITTIARVSAEPAGSPPQTSTTSADRPQPSDSPINTTSHYHSSSTLPPSAEAYYDYMSKRLMKSSWLYDYSKEKLTDFYRQQIPQDLTNHLDHLGLTSRRISELLNLLNFLPDLDFSFISKKTSSSIVTPTTPGANPITNFHPLPAPQQTPNQINPTNAHHHPPPVTMITVPTNFNLIENFSLSYLKDILGVISCHLNYLKVRLDRFEIRLGNAEKLGKDDHGNITTLMKRMDFAEAQVSQLAASKATSDDLLALQSQIDARLTCAQREAKESVKTCWDKVAKLAEIQNSRLAAPSQPLHPPTPSAGQSTHQRSLSMATVEHHILDRLFIELGRLSAPASSTADGATDTGKEDEPRPMESDKRELEEGETSGEEEELKDTIESILTDDRTANPQTNRANTKPGDPSARWKALIRMAKSQYQQYRQKEKEALVYNHHHHHHQHHRVRMIIGLSESSNQTGTIDALRIGRQAEGEELALSAEHILAEQRHEEIVAEQSISHSAPSIQPTPDDGDNIPVNPPTNAASNSA